MDQGRDGRLLGEAGVSKVFRTIALQEDTTLQALVGEAIDMLLVQRGHKPCGAR